MSCLFLCNVFVANVLFFVTALTDGPRLIADEPAADAAFHAFVRLAVFAVEVEQGLRLEGVVRLVAGSLPSGYVAVGLGREMFQQGEGPFGERFVQFPLAKSQKNGCDGVDDDGLGGLSADVLR